MKKKKIKEDDMVRYGITIKEGRGSSYN